LLIVPRLVAVRRRWAEPLRIRLALAISTAESLRRASSEDASPRRRVVVRRELGGSARALRALARSSLRESRGQSAEDAEVRPARSSWTAQQAIALEWPVRGPITSGFGRRWGRMHRGIDIGVPEGTPVRAAAPGTVTFAGWLDGDGNVLVIDHGAGLSTAYLHLSSILVSSGPVAAGTEIGTSGCTGYCFGPHLHFELRVDGTPIDPLPVLSAAATLGAQRIWRSSEIASPGCCRPPPPSGARPSEWAPSRRAPAD
jgi:murein DD-endopeptidase MepM/ murein hydrolase activator NlpD